MESSPTNSPKNNDIKKALLMAIFTVAIVTLAIMATNSYAKKTCNNMNGEYRILNGSGNKVCILNYSDGGYDCTTSMDCQGRCYIHEDGQSPKCEYNNDPSKCIGTLSLPPLCGNNVERE